MRSLRVVEAEIPSQTTDHGGNCLIVVEVQVLVFDAAPEPLDEDVVEHAPVAIHTDLYAGGFQARREGLGCELAALIRVEDHRPPILKRPLHCDLAGAALQTVGKLPGDNVAAKLIHHGH